MWGMGSTSQVEVVGAVHVEVLPEQRRQECELFIRYALPDALQVLRAGWGPGPTLRAGTGTEGKK